MTAQLYHPLHRIQNDGGKLGWKNCTCTAGAVCTDLNTQGKVQLTGSQVRTATGDKKDGTTPDQVDAALLALTGEDQLDTGYWTPKDIRAGIRKGRTFLACVVYETIRAEGARQRAAGVKQRDLVAGSELFAGWHAIALHMELKPGESVTIRCEAAGPHQTFTSDPAELDRAVFFKTLTQPADATEPATVVYDPLLDGRRRTVGEGAVLYSKDLLKRAFAASHLVPGKIYGAFTLPAWIPEPPDPGEPTPPPPSIHLRPGAKEATSAFQGAWVTLAASFLRSSPRKRRSDPMGNVVRSVEAGYVFRCRQTTNGTLIKGSRKWLGNRGGSVWIHESRVERPK